MLFPGLKRERDRRQGYVDGAPGCRSWAFAGLCRQGWGTNGVHLILSLIGEPIGGEGCDALAVLGFLGGRIA